MPIPLHLPVAEVRESLEAVTTWRWNEKTSAIYRRLVVRALRARRCVSFLGVVRD
jgi:hypothetical protein